MLFIQPSSLIVSSHTWMASYADNSDKNTFYAPNIEKVEGAYCFGLVRPCVHLSVRYKFKIVR